MANTKSAKKATRKIARRTSINKSRRSRLRTYVRKVEEAIAGGADIAPILDVGRIKGGREDLIACRRLLDAALKDG